MPTRIPSILSIFNKIRGASTPERPNRSHRSRQPKHLKRRVAHPLVLLLPSRPRPRVPHPTPPLGRRKAARAEEPGGTSRFESGRPSHLPMQAAESRSIRHARRSRILGPKSFHHTTVPAAVENGHLNHGLLDASLFYELSFSNFPLLYSSASGVLCHAYSRCRAPCSFSRSPRLSMEAPDAARPPPKRRPCGLNNG